MARKPLQKIEDIASAPEGEIDIEISDPIVSIVKDDDPVDPPKKTTREKPVVEDENPLQKQLDDLRKTEADNKLAREAAERRAQEAERRAQEAESRHSASEVSQLESEYDSVLNAINAAESEAAAATQAYERAAENGDYKAMGEQQRKISRAEARLEGLEQGKSVLESRREALKTKPQTQTNQSDQFEASISQYPESAKTWIRNHREFMSHPRNSIKVQAAHYDAIEAGHAAYSPEYFSFLETQVGLKQKTDPEIEDDKPEERRTPVSAPVSRDPPSPGTGRATPQRVTLTAEERETARQVLHREGMKPGEAERIYAENKLRMIEAKKNGHYREGQ